MRFRIKLYREVKLWLVGVPFLVLTGLACKGATAVQATAERGSWERTYWEGAAVVFGVICIYGAVALLACTAIWGCQRIRIGRLFAWVSRDD